MTLVERIIGLHQALKNADVPHAFGGALALAWCTQQARGTVDIDINLFVSNHLADAVLDALPDGVAITEADRRAVASDGQTRLWWDETPVDVFFNTTEFHEQVAARARVEDFAGHRLPFLSCNDLSVFKAFFDRGQDWVDIEEMARAGSLDAEWVGSVLAGYLGDGDHRVKLLRELADQ